MASRSHADGWSKVQAVVGGADTGLKYNSSGFYERKIGKLFSPLRVRAMLGDYAGAKADRIFRRNKIAESEDREMGSRLKKRP